MSRHHIQQRWTTHMRKLRPAIQAQLPLPCVECGGAVLPDQVWHVAHRQAASRGGQPTLANCGPAHSRCNLQAGGRLGAQVSNGQRKRSQQAQQGIRPW